MCVSIPLCHQGLGLFLVHLLCPVFSEQQGEGALGIWWDIFPCAGVLGLAAITKHKTQSSSASQSKHFFLIHGFVDELLPAWAWLGLGFSSASFSETCLSFEGPDRRGSGNQSPVPSRWTAQALVGEWNTGCFSKPLFRTHAPSCLPIFHWSEGPRSV